MSDPFTATDDEIRIRAVMNEKHGNHAPGPLLHGLVLAVDAFVGEPTDEDLRRLAWDYCETVSIVKAVFEIRREIRARRVSVRPKASTLREWLDFEDAEIRELWKERSPTESAKEVDSRIAASLSSMPGNVRRGVTRSAYAVATRRIKIGLVMSRDDYEWRRCAS